MTIQDLYSALQGDYNEVMSRIGDEKYVAKYLKKFTETDYSAPLREAAEAKNWEEVFKSSHNIKGLALNLGMSVMNDISSDLCELLRGKTEVSEEEAQKAETLSQSLVAEYKKTADMIAENIL